MAVMSRPRTVLPSVMYVGATGLRDVVRATGTCLPSPVETLAVGDCAEVGVAMQRSAKIAHEHCLNSSSEIEPLIVVKRFMNESALSKHPEAQDVL